MSVQMIRVGYAMPSFSLSPRLALAPLMLGLASCTTLGSLMSPYSERFSCKNNDHGQCVHPDKAYRDAVAGRHSTSDPKVTRDRAMPGSGEAKASTSSGTAPNTLFYGYRDSVYRELQGLIDAPVTPMLRPSRSVRTLILPYADGARPDRLYMPRYVYSLLDRPQWVIGDYLVEGTSAARAAPVLDQAKATPAEAGDMPVIATPVEVAP